LGSNSEPVSVSFRRTGGIVAGAPLEIEVAQSDLDLEGAEALAEVLGGEGPARFTALPERGTGADEYQYDLAIRRGDEVVALQFAESRLPPELGPLVEVLEQRALEGPPGHR
jgi:hypothetical protein